MELAFPLIGVDQHPFAAIFLVVILIPLSESHVPNLPASTNLWFPSLHTELNTIWYSQYERLISYFTHFHRSVESFQSSIPMFLDETNAEHAEKVQYEPDLAAKKAFTVQLR